MSDKLDLYKAIAEREKASRKEAERLLEEIGRMLYDKNQTLESTARELQTANNLLSEVMAVAPDGILLCSVDLTVRVGNTACQRHFGCDIAEIVGRQLSDFFPDAERIADHRAGEFAFDRFTAQRADGAAFPVELRGYAGRINDQVSYLLTFHDITTRLAEEERRNDLEAQISEARRLEAIGALSAGIAHEINTPIQFIGDNLDYLGEALGQAYGSYKRYEALRAAVKDDDRYTDLVAEVDAFNSSIGLADLTNEVMAALTESRDGIRQVRDIVLLMKEFAHPGAIEKEATNLNDIARNVATLCRNQQKGVAEIEFDLAEDLPLVQCRRGQVQQVVLNLVVNALGAVRDADAEQGRILIKTAWSGGRARLSVSDTGPGVPEELRQKIFDPFFTTKPVGKGTGQGLALAKDCIVKGHGGCLCLTDVDGFATTFLIDLPIDAAEVAGHSAGQGAAGKGVCGNAFAA